MSELQTNIRRQLRLALNDAAADELLELANAKGGDMSEATQNKLRSTFGQQAEAMIDSFKFGEPMPDRQMETLSRACGAFWVGRELNALLF